MEFLVVLIVFSIVGGALLVNGGNKVRRHRKFMEFALSFTDHGYATGEIASNEQLHEVTFAVKQRNLEKMEKILLDISDPMSDNYGKHLTRKEVANLTANYPSTNYVKHYLRAKNISITHETKYGEYITAIGNISTWKEMLDTEFYHVHHISRKMNPIFRALHYSLPFELVPHVHLVFNTVQLPHWREIAPLRSVNTTQVGTTTPDFINSYYNVFSNAGSSRASQSIFGTSGQYYSPSDLVKFQRLFNIPEQPVSASIGGRASDAACQIDVNQCKEANVDLQYITAISQQTPTSFWYEEGADTFVAWIISVSNTDNPPLVHSISYLALESQVSSSSAQQFNTEAQKLGLQGVSIIVCSGDDGAVGFLVRAGEAQCGYAPKFPATSPFVTTVGATQGAESRQAEIALMSNLNGGKATSGGGFSNLFPAPDYQFQDLVNYFQSLGSLPVPGFSRTGRGYPDIAMAGLNYQIMIGGQIYQGSGTSSATPVVAAMVSLVNAARLNAGKPALGLLNPAIYRFKTQFTNDITIGNNNCAASTICCPQGFFASPGWDPVTGFGSVDYQRFYDIFYNL